MGTLVVWFALALSGISLSSAALPHTTCERDYEKVGCYKDIRTARALPDRLINDRDATDDTNDGHFLDWYKWKESIHSLACRCSAAAKKKGYSFFAIQFYAECWSGPNTADFAKHGKADDKNCFSELTTDVKNRPPCDKKSEDECVGIDDTNYVYKVKEDSASSVVNGGYSAWSKWTECSVTCGGGTRQRERSCTNPEPSNGGRDCLHLGESEETEACNKDACPEPAVDGGWSDWTKWTACTVTCGGGTRVRERSCTNPAPQGKGKHCEGSASETRSCGNDPCPIPCKKAMDIGIILDGSGSVRPQNFQKAKDFISDLITHYKVSPDGTHFGIITYSTRPSLQFTIGDARFHNFMSLKNKVASIRYPNGWTRTDLALDMASKQLFTSKGGDRDEKPNILIVFTDGKTNRGSKPYPTVLAPLQAKGVRIVAVGIGQGFTRRELLEIALGNPHYVVQVSDFDALKDKLNVILAESCQGSPPPTPEPECTSASHALGMASGAIKDAQLNASSSWDGNHGADRSRLHIVRASGKRGAWSARYNDRGQYLQVDFSKPIKLTKIDIQGREDANQWVTEYWVSYSLDGGIYRPLYTPKGNVKYFIGNRDRNTVVSSVLEEPIYPRFVRIHPSKWYQHISLRLEFHGCRNGFTQLVMPLCSSALGLQSGLIKDSQMTASSELSSSYSARHGRLHYQGGGWIARAQDQKQWLQVNFGKMAKVRRVALQGRSNDDQWVQTYSLSSSRDGIVWEDYQQSKVFLVKSSDRYTVALSEELKPPIKAQYVRIRPVTWRSHIAMRAEFYGCTSDFEIPKVLCASPLGMKSKAITDSRITASSTLNSNHSPQRARLDTVLQDSLKGAWSAKTNDMGQWLQIDMGRATKVTRIVTQGRSDANQWVKSYKIQFSQQDLFHDYREGRTFEGNKDTNTKYGHVLNPPIIARYVRVLPVTWHGHISMRMELFGCTEGFEPPPRPECLKAIGAQSGTLKDSQFFASSELSSSYRASNARLHLHTNRGRVGAWSPSRSDKNPWLEIDVGRIAKVTGISTQGQQDANYWVTSYALQYSLDGSSFTTFSVSRNPKVFEGNKDRSTVRSHALAMPILARYVRVRPMTWRGRIAMRVEIFGCTSGFPLPPVPECMAPLGLQRHIIKDKQMEASSVWSNTHGAANARLYFYPHDGRTGGWSSRKNDGAQWLQVDLGKQSKVTMIGTQGREGYNQWVKEYMVAYSRKGLFWEDYKEGGAKKLFKANRDQNTVVKNKLQSPIYARFIRIQPKKYYGHISMRAELYGCTEGFVAPPVKCAAPLGMKDKSIPDKSITASSEWDANHSPDRSRLDTARQDKKTGAWSARHNNRAQWLQIDFGKATQVTGIVTQGRNDFNQWVQGYKLEFSQDNIHFISYEGGKVLKGNSDRDSKVSHILEPAIIARYVRLRPQSWYGHISMRLELYGCRKGFNPPPKIPCHEHSLGVQSGFIKDSQMSASTIWDINHGAENARLNGEKIGSKTGAWSARYNNAEQWLQVDLGELSEVYKVATQGRQDLNQWVKSYTLAYSRDGALFQYLPKLLSGNKDRDTVEFNSVGKIHARYLRFYPKTWFGHISMRVEVYGCHKGSGGGDPNLPPPCSKKHLDIGVVMDRSGSVRRHNFDKAKKFVERLIDHLDVGSKKTRVGLIAFNSFPSTYLKFSQTSLQTPERVLKQLKAIRYTGGGTRTDLALEEATKNLFSSRGGDRSDKPNVLIVMTDGQTNTRSKPYGTVLKPLLRKGVKIIAVGVGSSIKKSELKQIANGNANHVIKVLKFDDLLPHLPNVLRASCV